MGNFGLGGKKNKWNLLLRSATDLTRDTQPGNPDARDILTPKAPDIRASLFSFFALRFFLEAINARLL